MQGFLGSIAQWLADRDVLSGLLVAAVVSAVTWVFNAIRARREKALSYRLRFNSRLGFDPPDAGPFVRLSGPSGREVEDPGMVVVRIKNVGRTSIEESDYVAPLGLSFPGRDIMSVDVTEADPPPLQEVITTSPEFQVGPHSIDLPRVHLNTNSQFKLVVLLGGTRANQKYEVKLGGYLRNGQIIRDADQPRVRRLTVVASIATLILVTASVVAAVFSYGLPRTSPPEGLRCVSGSLIVEGSSAFGFIASKAAGVYQSFCPDAMIDVRTPGSLDGLNRLRDASDEERARRLALSDGLADTHDYPKLVPTALAVVPYVLVANRTVPVDNLTHEQVGEIFTGQVTRWSEITGDPRDDDEIRVVGRTTQSGSRRTLEKYVLGTPDAPGRQADDTSDNCKDRRRGAESAAANLCVNSSTNDVLKSVQAVDFAIGYADAPDASQLPEVKAITIDGQGAGSLDDIRQGYPFWTVEYLYSYGVPATGSLASAFADYLAGRDSRDSMAVSRYFPCVRTDGTAEPLCAAGR
jgi:phosphate transport system substrate-binding protein